MPDDGSASFAGHRHLSLETVRRNGTPVAMPVWFVADGGTLYARTFAKTGKVRRLRHGGRVRVAPCDREGRPSGPWLTGAARLVDGAEARRADRLLTRRYGLRKRVADLWYRRRLGAVVVIAIRPASPSVPGDGG